MNTIDPQATAVTRVRYDRNARRYDRMTCCTERLMTPGRAGLWQRVRGPQVLEVGVGTGKSFPYYPAGMAITAIDLSPRMLEQARTHAARDRIVVDLREADVQALSFPDASFDTAIASCVFCSVPDPALGLRELRRVLAPRRPAPAAGTRPVAPAPAPAGHEPDQSTRGSSDRCEHQSRDGRERAGRRLRRSAGRGSVAGHRQTDRGTDTWPDGGLRQTGVNTTAGGRGSKQPRQRLDDRLAPDDRAASHSSHVFA